MSKPETILFLSDARGIYIPRDFADSIKREAIAAEFHERLDELQKGPPGSLGAIGEGCADYWDVWQEVLDSAVVTDSNGVQFTLYQDGDLWLIPKGMEWDDSQGFFVWPQEEEA